MIKILFYIFTILTVILSEEQNYKTYKYCVLNCDMRRE